MNFIMFSVDWNIKLEILEYKWMIPYEWMIFQNGYKDVLCKGGKKSKEIEFWYELWGQRCHKQLNIVRNLAMEP